MERRERPYWLTGLVAGFLAFLVFLVGSASSGSDDPYDCYGCHKELYDEELGKSFVHSPFLKKQCSTCHLSSGSSNADSATATNQQDTLPEGVTWFAEDLTQTTTHWFLFSSKTVSDTIFVRATDEHQQKAQKKLALPPMANLTQTTDDHTPPEISNVRIVEVKRGVFTSARIAWETNEVSDSMVIYGLKGLDMSSPLNCTLTKQHEVTLTGLLAPKTYQFAVVSQDIFGQKAAFKTLSLSTANAVPSPTSSNNNVPPSIEFASELSGAGDNYLLKLTINKVAAVSLGNLPANSKKTTTVVMPTNHLPIKSKFDTNITICYTCHADVKQALSHPVNVFPKEGMTIPADYTTLPDGRLTCNSCHAYHAADIEFRLIKSSKKELCVGCHADMK